MEDRAVPGEPEDSEEWMADHPFPVNSLDALEAFRREQLPGWEWWNVGWQQERVEAGMMQRETARLLKKYGPDEWTARAAALIAAKEAK